MNFVVVSTGSTLVEVCNTITGCIVRTTINPGSGAVHLVQTFVPGEHFTAGAFVAI